MMVEKKQINFPRYEQYKDSGISEIGKIPRGWGVSKFKYYYKCAMGETLLKEDLSKNGHIPVYSATEQDVIFGYVKNATILLQKGDLVIPARGNSIGNVKIMKEISTCTQTTIYARKINHILSKYVYFYLRGNKNYLFRFTQTAIPQITVREVSDGYLLVPPSDEQTAIAQFLDHKTAQIDRAIAIKEAQIKLLNERKQIMIQEAVTKGLDPSVPMKDSGIEWIGEIPAHWEVRRAKYLFDEIDERSKTGAEELLSVSHMTGVTPRSEKTVHMFLAEDYSGSKLCRKGDIIFNIMWAWMGALGVSYQTGIVSPSYAVFREKEDHKFNPKYVEFLLKSKGYIEHYNKVSTGLHSSRLRFYSKMFFDMKIGFPSYEEQNLIILYLDKISEKIDLAIGVYKSQIQTLKEYKTTLINEAVTGKIKVY